MYKMCIYSFFFSNKKSFATPENRTQKGPVIVSFGRAQSIIRIPTRYTLIYYVCNITYNVSRYVYNGFVLLRTYYYYCTA